MQSRLNSPKEIRDYAVFLRELFGASDPARVRTHLSELSVPPPFKLRAKVVRSRRGLADALRPEVGTRLFPLSSTGDGFVILSGPKANPADAAFTTVFPAAQQDFHIIVSISQREPW